MCGIAGALDLEGLRLFDADRLRRMVRALSHRGPDGEGMHIEPGIALGARRLALVDIAHGAQPIADERGERWVIANGELYEDDALRRDLEARGHVLRSRCDTELWPHLYEEHGTALFGAVHGEFAVAIWDRPSRTLILGRDRFGVRPLYVAQKDGFLLWASEIKGLLASGMVPARLDPRGLDYSFTFFSAGGSRSLFEGVTSLAPGSFTRIQSGQISHVSYFEPRFPNRGEERRVADPRVLVDEFDHHLQRAVKRRLRGDVPVVSYLSGGLDSSVILAIASRMQGKPMPAFAISLNRAGPDERHKSRAAANAVGAPLDTIVLDHQAIANAYPDVVAAAEEPVVDTSNPCLAMLAQKVRQRGYRVALTGEGADEALAGYFWYKVDRCLRALSPRGIEWIPDALRWSAGTLVGGRRLFPHRPFAGIRTAQVDMHDALGQARDHFYAPALWERLAGSSPLDEMQMSDEMRKWDPLHQALYVDYKLMLPGHLLAGKGDRMAMSHAVETRYPFLDHDVFDFCASLAPEYKLNGLSGKWLLRRLARRYLPASIAAEPKSMLRADRARSLLGPHRPAWVDELLDPQSIEKTGLFRSEVVARQRARQIALPMLSPRRWVFDATLTAIVGTQLLCHLFFGGGLCSLPTWQVPEVRVD